MKKILQFDLNLVKGVELTHKTGCAHYHSELDIIAIKFYCCQEFYACYYCHAALANHQTKKWPKEELNAPAILCGNCGIVMKILDYYSTTNCLRCSAQFNPRCRLHWDLYFE